MKMPALLTKLVGIIYICVMLPKIAKAGIFVAQDCQQFYFMKMPALRA